VRWWRRWGTRLVAADPGLRRARTATQVILAVALAVAVGLPLLSVLGQPVIAVAPGVVVAMVSTLAVREGGRAGMLTTLLMPVPASVSFVLGAATRQTPLLGEAVFLVVMFVAVYVRRFGPRAFALGMAAFLGFFLTLVLAATPDVVPAMAGAAVVGAAATLLVRYVLLRERPERAWQRGVQALRARVRTLMIAIDDVGEEPDSAPRRRRMHDELLRLNATALALASGFAALDALPAAEADALRERILDLELAAGAVVTAVGGLIAEPADRATRSVAARATHALGDAAARGASGVGDAIAVTRDVADQLDGAGSPAVGMALRRVAAAAADLGTATRAVQGAPDVAPEDGPEEPAPSDEPEAPDEPDEPDGLRPTTRTAVQVVVAGALSIVIGGLVVPGQWYWAVITAFVVFVGVATRGELLVRAWARVAGTLGGLVAGVVAATLLSGHPVAEVVAVLVCVFLAFYLVTISYGAMTFFVTAMVGVLYGLIGRFSLAFLEIRLVETVIGAAAGVFAALFVLPTRTRGAVRESLGAFLGPLAELLRAAAADLRAGPEVAPLAPAARDVDDRMHELLTRARPFGQYRVGDSRARYERWRQLVSTSATATRGFSRTVGPAAATSDADTRERLAELAETVADLADAVADRTPTDALTERACAQEGTLVDLVEAVHAGPTALRVTIHELGRLRGVLTDLSREFGPPRTGVRR
jgi:uncharacterized membrane protein YccC